MYYFKNKKTGKYLDYKYQDTNSKKDAFAYDEFDYNFERVLFPNYYVVDENDKIIG